MSDEMGKKKKKKPGACVRVRAKAVIEVVRC